MNVSKNQEVFIVLPQAASECLEYAAEELTYLLSECLGVKAKTVTDEQTCAGAIFSLGETSLVKAISFSRKSFWVLFRYRARRNERA